MKVNELLQFKLAIPGEIQFPEQVESSPFKRMVVVRVDLLVLGLTVSVKVPFMNWPVKADWPT